MQSDCAVLLRYAAIGSYLDCNYLFFTNLHTIGKVFSMLRINF